MLRTLRYVTASAAIASVTVIATASSATAVWSQSGSGDGRSRARTLATPSVSAKCDFLISTTIHVTWTADPTPFVKEFTVERSSDGGAHWALRGTVTATPEQTTYQYSDTGLALATYLFRVTAVNQSWSATSANTSPRTIVLAACL